MNENLKGASGIEFKEDEIKKYPMLLSLNNFLDVLAIKGSKYAGITGEIEEIRYGDNKITENECIVEIVVSNMKGIETDSVIMSESDLAICFNLDTYQLLTGQLVCENCYTPINEATRIIKEEDIYFWEDGKYKYRKDEDIHQDLEYRCKNCNKALELGDIVYSAENY